MSLFAETFTTDVLKLLTKEYYMIRSRSERAMKVTIKENLVVGN